MNGLIPDIDLLPQALWAPSGTRTLFCMAAPPVGWKQDTTAGLADCALRVNTSSTGGIAGGSTNWSGWNFTGASVTTTSMTLSISTLPVHSHTVVDGGHVASGSRIGIGAFAGGSGGTNMADFGGGNMYLVTSSTNTVSSNVFVNTAGGSAASFQIGVPAPAVKYNDYLIGIKK